MRTLKQILNEGGNAIKLSSRIRQEDVAETLKDIEKKVLPRLKLKPSDITTLGSTGKKRLGETSGDMDIGVNARSLIYSLDIRDAKEIYNVVLKKIKPLVKEIISSPGFGTVSFAWPIANQKNKYVQVDFMIVDDMNLAKFTFWSPKAETSNWKGLYRNIMLASIAGQMDFRTIKTGYDKEGNEIPVEFERNFMDVKRGLIRGIQTRIGKTGKLLSKKKTLATKVIANEPQKIIDMLLGPTFKPEDANSFEALIKILDNPKFIFKSKKKDILKAAADTINDIKGLTLPKELKKYL